MPDSQTNADPSLSWWDKYGLGISGLITLLIIIAFSSGAYWLGDYCSVKQDQQFTKEIYQKAVAASDQFENEAGSAHENGDNPSTFTYLINTYPSVRNSDEARNPPQKEQVGWWQSFLCEVKVTDFLIALFTLGLVLVTYFLWDATHRLWKSGEKQIAAAMVAAKAAQSQAETTRREFLLANRPLMRIQAATLFGRDGTTNGPHLSPEFPIRGNLYVINNGLTVATIMDSSLEVFIHEGYLPARPPYEIGEREPFIHGKWSAGQFDKLPIRGPQCAREMVDLILADEPITGLNLYVLGFIRYMDELNNPRTTRFCRRYRPNQREFVSVENPDYEYEE